MSDETTKLLQKLQNGELSLDDCQKELKSKTTQKAVTYKVSKKGCISFYGIRRMPISLYLQELESILKVILDIDGDEMPYGETFQSFVDENDGNLSVKE